MCTIIFYKKRGFTSRQSSRDVTHEKITGKFVQLRSASKEFLVFAPLDLFRYHADILERFCNQRGITGIYLDTEKRYEILDSDWSVIGGGKFMVDTTQRNIRLFDNSMAYGKFNRRGMRGKILSSGRFSGYHVQIE